MRNSADTVSASFEIAIHVACRADDHVDRRLGVEH